MSWFNALRLTERPVVGTSVDEQGKIVLAKLKSDRLEASVLRAKLAHANLDEDILAHYLTNPVENMEVPEPEWIKECSTVFTPSSWDGNQDFGSGFYGPVLSREVQRVRANLGSDKLASTFAQELKSILSTASQKVLATELNALELDALEDSSTFEQYLSAHRLTLSQKYPVLARRLIILARNNGDAFIETVQRMHENAQELLDTFGINGQLTDAVSSGDPHRGQRRAMLLEFSDGKRLVYKPRSLASDCLVGELFHWLNIHGFSHPLEHPRALDKGDWGVVEYVRASVPVSIEQTNALLRRLGGALAVLYLVGATDQHRENIIICGSLPYFIDLETIMRPRFTNDMEEAVAAESVLMVGILPNRSLGRRDSEGIDLSIFAGKEQQLAARMVTKIIVTGNRARYQQVSVPLDINPLANALSAVSVSQQSNLLQQGYAEAHDLMTNGRTALLPILKNFANSTRVLVRNTDTYGQLLEHGFHPKFSANAIEAELFFDKLWKFPLLNMPELLPLVPREIEDVWHGDVPVFYANGEGKLTGHTNQLPLSYVAQPGQSLALKRLARLSEIDKKRQLSVIAVAMSSARGVLPLNDYPVDPLPPEADESRAPTPDELIQVATHIGEHLVALAYQDERRASWLGPLLAYRRGWFTAPLRLDLYSGLPGMIVFLASLAHTTGNSRFLLLAEDAYAALQEVVQRSRHSYDYIGGFHGWGGLIYTYFLLAKLWNRRDIFQEAEKFLPEVEARITRDEYLDVVSGCAGSVLACLAGASSGSEAAIATARRAGDELVRRAQVQDHGVGWLIKTSPRRALTGFAHGAAGIALALERLAAVTGEAKYADIAHGALLYERSVFSHKHQTWPDFREEDVEGRTLREVGYMHAWCNGSIGIALARARSPEIDAEKHEEILIGVRAAITQRYGQDFTPCHGDAAKLELLAHMSDATSKATATRILSTIVSGIKRGDHRCGLPFRGEAPGLMVGMSGVGLTLLRSAVGATVASPLTLDLPNED